MSASRPPSFLASPSSDTTGETGRGLLSTSPGAAVDRFPTWGTHPQTGCAHPAFKRPLVPRGAPGPQVRGVAGALEAPLPFAHWGALAPSSRGRGNSTHSPPPTPNQPPGPRPPAAGWWAPRRGDVEPKSSPHPDPRRGLRNEQDLFLTRLAPTTSQNPGLRRGQSSPARRGLRREQPACHTLSAPLFASDGVTGWDEGLS